MEGVGGAGAFRRYRPPDVACAAGSLCGSHVDIFSIRYFTCILINTADATRRVRITRSARVTSTQGKLPIYFRDFRRAGAGAR